jgi:hypothetical protein
MCTKHSQDKSLEHLIHIKNLNPNSGKIVGDLQNVYKEFTRQMLETLNPHQES